jgi:hypothetical protein
MPDTSPQPSAESPPAATGARSPSRWKTLSFWTRAIAALIVVLVASWAVRATDTLTHLAAQVRWSFSSPPSEIYVESPEVYTRERLINERSAEEAWLNDQLKTIDSADLSRTNIVQRLLDSASVKVAESSAPPNDASSPNSAEQKASAKSVGEDASLKLTFDQDFRLRSAYRSLVRQRMIENRLDDRHDLEGNALYILKFDSTVLGIPAFRQRAIVKVGILPPGELHDLTAFEPATVLRALDSDPAIFEYAYANFTHWQRSLQQRMNKELGAEIHKLKSKRLVEYENHDALLEHISAALEGRKVSGVDVQAILESVSSGTYKSQDRQAVSAVMEELYYYLARETVAKVIGDDFLDVSVVVPDQSGVSGPGVRQVLLTSPLTREYVLVTLKFAPELATPPVMEVYPATSNLFITDRSCNLSDQGYPEYFQTLARGDLALWQHFQQQVPAGDDVLASMMDLVNQKLDSPNMAKGVLKANRNPAKKGCEVNIGVWAETGLINFSRRIGRFNTYSYSVLPRENPVSVFNDIASATDAAASLGQVRAGRTQQRSTGGWELRPVLSTFGDTVRVAGGADAGLPAPAGGHDATGGAPRKNGEADTKKVSPRPSRSWVG